MGFSAVIGMTIYILSIWSDAAGCDAAHLHDLSCQDDMSQCMLVVQGAVAGNCTTGDAATRHTFTSTREELQQQSYLGVILRLSHALHLHITICCSKISLHEE